MSTASDQANDQARFAAREFVARWARETGETSAVVTDRMLFAYEMGYLRGRSEATRVAVEMLTELSQTTASSEGNVLSQGPVAGSEENALLQVLVASSEGNVLSQGPVAGTEENALSQSRQTCTEGNKDDASFE